MGYARAHGVALRGAVGHLVDVQADVSPGLVGVTLVGRADSVLAEGRDRVRMAIINSDLEWPATKRITVLLSPADLPKGGSHYDLSQ